MSDFIKGLWPRSVFAWLGLALSVMSLVVLLRHAVDYGLAVSLGLMLEFYEQMMRTIFGPFEPYIESYLRWIVPDLQLFPHWKHVLSLMLLYFWAKARVVWRAGNFGFAAFTAAWGLGVALLTSIAVGTVPLEGNGDSQAGLVIMGVAGYVLYEIGNLIVGTLAFRRDDETLYQSLLAFAKHPHYRAAFATLVALGSGLLFDRVPIAESLPNIGLAVLLLLVVALAIYWVARGIAEARGIFGDRYEARKLKRSRKFERDRETNPQADDAYDRRLSWTDAVANAGTLSLGLLMFRSLGGVALFVVANAGLQQVGL